MNNHSKEAHQRYVALEEIKLSVIENEKNVRRKLMDDGINDVKKKKFNLETCVEALKKNADKLSYEVERKIDLTLIIKANYFRKTTTKKVASTGVLDKAIVKLQKEKNMKISIHLMKS